MAQYDFRTLSSVDFEVLVRDLLQKKLGIPLESFARGRDGGIDLRHIVPVTRRPAPTTTATAGAGSTLIIQCKHYVDSGYAKLLSNLKKEVEKAKRLNPTRYMVATSVALSAANKEEIKTLFAPHVLTADDILGAGDINGLLSNYPDIERATIKLYITSLAAISDTLNHDLHERTRAMLANANVRIQTYVKSHAFGRALAHLDADHVCIIAGIPGVGKSTLAEMLILYYANEGYRPVTISGDIAEADRVYDIDEKQVFYYDDFLGQTGLADKLSKNEDARLSEFISRISKTKQKRFILTTREYILQQSGLQYEKLDTLVRTTSFQYVLAMSQYSRLDKASILFNHLYFSRLDKTIQRELLVDRGYYKIIDHDNYNPRLLAGVIAQIERSPLQPGNLLQRILRTLDSPSELWSHPFERQLDLDARKFLLALLSLPVRVEVQDAIGAFSALLPASSAIEQKSRDCLRVLEDTFTKTEMINGVHLLSFHNPSVRDFLKGYVAANSAVLIELLDGANFFSQCEYLFELARPPHFAQFAPSVPVRTPPPEIHHADLATALFKTFVRTFRSNSCRIDVDHLQRASLVAKSYVNISERLATAVKITLSLELHDAARAWINEQLIEVGARWAENQNELEAAADLLELLKDTSLVTGERLGELAEHLGRLLWDWASSPEEFVLLSNFVGEFSESISEDSLSELAGRIVKSEIYSIRNDSDGVADAEARFEELKAFCKGQGLEIDPDDVRRVDESIADMQSSEDIRDDHYSGQSWQSPRSPSSDSDAPMIDAMFGLLSDDD